MNVASLAAIHARNLEAVNDATATDDAATKFLVKGASCAPNAYE
jgi:hypothetical protein